MYRPGPGLQQGGSGKGRGWGGGEQIFNAQSTMIFISGWNTVYQNAINIRNIYMLKLAYCELESRFLLFWVKVRERDSQKKGVLSCLLLQQMAGIDLVTSKADMPSPPLTDHRSKACSAFLVAAHIMDKLGPLLVSRTCWRSLLAWSGVCVYFCLVLC